MKVKKLTGVLLLLGLLLSCSQKPQKVTVKRNWHQASGYRWAPLKPLKNGKTGFKLLNSKQTGITFQNHLSKKEITHNRLLLNGSGVAAGDINGDGLVDIYFTQLEGSNALYENLGNWKFKNITQSAGVALKNYKCTGAVLADVDGDGDLDLLVSTYNHGTVLFLNDGSGHFTRDKNSGLDSETVGGTTMSLADIDGDGDLDLYVTHYRAHTVRDLFTPPELAGRKVAERAGKGFRVKKRFQKYYTIIDSNVGPQLREYGTSDELYLNNGGVGKKWRGFKKVKDLKDHFLSPDGKKIGVGKNWGLTARFEDINNDGRPDLYVCNDYWTPDQFWINQGNDVFKLINPIQFRHTSFSSMSEAVGDVNNDGYPDLFVSDMLSPIRSRRLTQNQNLDPYPVRPGDITNQPQYSRNTLFINRGDNTFAETADYSGISASGWSWAATFMDVNLNGREDLLLNDGYSYNVLDMDTQLYLSHKDQQNPNDLQSYRNGILHFPPLKLVNRAYKNDGNLTFTDESTNWGFHEKDVSQGLALADLNNDGTLDIITNRMNEAAGVYENTTGAPRVAVKLIGNVPNTQAIGAKVVLRGGPVLQDKQVISGGNYLSGSDTQLMFAAGKNSNKLTMTIYWPDGKKSHIDSVRANRIYEINESKIPTQKDTIAPPKAHKPVFKDVSNRLNFKEHEDDYNDMKRQPLLPLKLSQEEPGMAWLDYNGDGRPDLFETSGKGGHMAVFENEGHGRFRKQNIPGIRKAGKGDQTAVIGWRTSKGLNLIVGRSNYEQKKPGGPAAYHYLIRDGRVVKTDVLSGSKSSTGPLAAADYNEDGSVDLFIGGRVIPGQYPQNASSELYKNVDGHFVLDKANSKILDKIGMVTGAVFTDYNRDGWPDLLLSTSWGTLKLFENNHGHFHDVTKQVGLNKYRGWWHGVATGDFNNDGYPDIVATNWGLNSRYKLIQGHPMRMYYGDLNSDHVLDIIQANYDTSIGAYAPIRPLNDYQTVRPMGYRVRSYAEYAHSSLRKIIGPVLEIIPHKEINTLASMVFINKNGKNFVAHPLPRQAQLTANFDAGVADYNNDGNEDIFLSQNFFDVPASDSRLDAGRGLWLKGNGKGNFTAVPGQKSGVKVYGEQRGAVLGDFNEDGRIDLAVSQNGNFTKLYENKTEKKGITIHLIGPAGNKNAIGSSIRLVYKNGQKGPEREIQAGSGYWSQNSSTQIMGYQGTNKPSAIEVTWFNGKKEKVKVSKHKLNYEITMK